MLLTANAGYSILKDSQYPGPHFIMCLHSLLWDLFCLPLIVLQCGTLWLAKQQICLFKTFDKISLCFHHFVAPRLKTVLALNHFECFLVLALFTHGF